MFIHSIDIDFSNPSNWDGTVVVEFDTGEQIKFEVGNDNAGSRVNAQVDSLVAALFPMLRERVRQWGSGD